VEDILRLGIEDEVVGEGFSWSRAVKERGRIDIDLYRDKGGLSPWGRRRTDVYVPSGEAPSGAECPISREAAGVPAQEVPEAEGVGQGA